MYGKGQGSVSARVAISVIVFYALVLQAFVAAGAPTGSFGALGDISCAPDDSRQGLPSGEHSDDHCPCCVLACAACAGAYAGTASDRVFPPRHGQILAFALVETTTICAPLRFCFAARGPPTDV